MLILIDTNVFPKVFQSSDSQHADFVPVFQWINQRHGQMVIGGSRYRKELEVLRKFGRLLKEYQNRGSIKSVDDGQVDAQEEMIKTKVPATDFDDPHLIALLGVSRCSLICTHDSRAIPYLQNRDLYPKGMKKVKIYSRPQHAHLLNQAKKPKAQARKKKNA